MGNNNSSSERPRYSSPGSGSWNTSRYSLTRIIDEDPPDYPNSTVSVERTTTLEESRKSSVSSSYDREKYLPSSRPLNKQSDGHPALPVAKVKVLPNNTGLPKLRPTDNGFALQNIGTITDRRAIHQQQQKSRNSGNISDVSLGSSTTKTAANRIRKKNKAPPAPSSAHPAIRRLQESSSESETQHRTRTYKAKQESALPASAKARSMEHLQAEEYYKTPKKLQAPPPEAQVKQKHFYFGMMEGDILSGTAPKEPRSQKRQLTSIDTDLEEESRKVLEEFDAVLDEHKPEKKAELEISLDLRPVLPRKPLQLPRFSPSSAWRSLGAAQREKEPIKSPLSLENAAAVQPQQQQSSRGSEISEDDDVFEERITRNARRMAPPRLTNEKSADSGISGDAGSPEMIAQPIMEKPLAMSSPVQRHPASHWTPEQDLDETSSEADPTAASAGTQAAQRRKSGRNTPPKFMPKSQMFASVLQEMTDNQSKPSSTPKGRRFRKKDEHLNGSSDSSSSGAAKRNSSLRQLQRSVSNAFASAAALRQRSGSSRPPPVNDDNWLLSRSAPNSIHNGLDPRAKFKSETNLLQEEDDPPAGLYPALSQPAITQRIVYLPQYDSKRQDGIPAPWTTHSGRNELMKRAKSADAVYLESRQLDALPSKGSDFAGPRQPIISSPKIGAADISKKFKFQSTLRMQEKKVLEAKLSREAEEQEKRRLEELEAMRRVEEEFQRKRAAEKANIREQLRRLQLENSWQVRQPPYGREEQREPIKIRLDPEGAPAAHPQKSPERPTYQQRPVQVVASPPLARNFSTTDVIKTNNKSFGSTEILSEFRQQRREYRDYRSPRVYTNFHRTSTPSGSNTRSTSVTTSNISDNYRLDFARRGAAAAKVHSSDVAAYDRSYRY